MQLANSDWVEWFWFFLYSYRAYFYNKPIHLNTAKCNSIIVYCAHWERVLCDVRIFVFYLHLVDALLFVQSAEKGYHLTWSQRELFTDFASINHSIDSKVNFNARFCGFSIQKLFNVSFDVKTFYDGLIIMFWLNMTNYLFACIEKSIFHGYNYEQFNGLSLTSERYYNLVGACYIVVVASWHYLAYSMQYSLIRSISRLSTLSRSGYFTFFLFCFHLLDTIRLKPYFLPRSSSLTLLLPPAFSFPSICHFLPSSIWTLPLSVFPHHSAPLLPPYSAPIAISPPSSSYLFWHFITPPLSCSLSPLIGAAHYRNARNMLMTSFGSDSDFRNADLK